MKFPAMFSPVKIGSVTVPNRFVVPPMGNNFANSNRYVYFSAEMESLLREYEAFCAAETARLDLRKLTKDDYVFRRKGMQLPMTPSTFTWRFKEILRANNLPDDLNVHSLRHTAASLFIANSTDASTVAELLGHRQLSTTLDICTHTFGKTKSRRSDHAEQLVDLNLTVKKLCPVAL